MVIDYSPAKQWAPHVHALAIVESNENDSVVGDGGQAVGLLQQHPVFFKEYYGAHNDFPVDDRDIWTVARIKAAATFFEIQINQKHRPLDLVIQAYNKGSHAVFINGVRNPEYLARFDAAWNKVKVAQ